MDALPRMTAATRDVLRALVDAGQEPVWGLRVVKLTGRPSGSVYPILERLESAGWITSSWEEDSSRPGPRRRLYQLTADGAHAAVRELTATARAPRTGAAPVRPGWAAT